MGIRVSQIIGGINIVNQSLELQSKPHVVVATPGRLYEHIKDNKDLFKSVKYLVLDEVDRLLSPSLYPKVREILDLLPENRIELLFSATITPAVEEYKKYLNDPYIYNATETDTVVDTIDQLYLFIPDQVKLCYLIYLLKHYGPYVDDDEKDNHKSDSLIIFTSTVKQCELLHEVLNVMEINSVAMHSVLTQGRRLASLGKFRSQLSKILIATDVASRGLDIPNVDLIINYDMPRDPRDYIHRIGRTGRNGKEGKSISLITQYDIELVHKIEDHIGTKLNEMKGIKENDVLLLLNKVNKSEIEANQRMLDYGFFDNYEEWKIKNNKGKRKNESEELDNNKKQKI